MRLLKVHLLDPQKINNQTRARGSDIRTSQVKKADFKQQENRLIKVATSSCRGYGRYLVAGYKVLMKVPKSLTETSYSAVFDGKEGKIVAKYASKQFRNRIIKTRQYVYGNLDAAITNVILVLEKEMEKKPNNYVGGLTTIGCLLRHKNENIEYMGDHSVGILGDCPCISSINENANNSSEDHEIPFSPHVISSPMIDRRFKDTSNPDVIIVQFRSGFSFG